MLSKVNKMESNLEIIDWAFINVLIAAADTNIMLNQTESKLVKYENDLPYDLSDLKNRVEEFQKTGKIDIEKLRTNISSVLTAMNVTFVG